MSTGSHNAYAAIEIGAWTNFDAIDFEILIDELFLVDYASVTTTVDFISANKNSALTSYPNPIIENAIISCALQETGFVNIAVYNVLGEQVATIANDNMAAGSYNFLFDASNLTDNLYFCIMKTNRQTSTIKMLVTR